ncbi:MAG: GNAT family N-acetyltransferase [Sneathiella sp.]|nr:GNAT family N-acetyltransferase [Sneathiella sp.]
MHIQQSLQKPAKDTIDVMTINISKGYYPDQESIIDFILLAGGGIFEQIFQSSLPGLTPRKALRLGIGNSNNPYSRQNSHLAKDKSDTVGCLLAFPENQFGLPAIVKLLIPKRRLAPLLPLFTSRLPDSFYINTLAVSEEHRGQGIAHLLLDYANKMAAAAGHSFLSLHVWSDNVPALRLYKRWGFVVTEEVEMPVTKYLNHAGPILLVKAPVKCGNGQP